MSIYDDAVADLPAEPKVATAGPQAVGTDLGVTEPVPAGPVAAPLQVVRAPGRKTGAPNEYDEAVADVVREERRSATNALLSQIEQERVVDAEKDQRLGALMEAARIRFPLQSKIDDQAAIKEIARRTGVRADIVELRLPEFRQKMEAAKDDPTKFRQENYELSAILLARPDAAPMAFRDETLNPLTQVLRLGKPFVSVPTVTAPELSPGNILAPIAQTAKQVRGIMTMFDPGTQALNLAENIAGKVKEQITGTGPKPPTPEEIAKLPLTEAGEPYVETPTGRKVFRNGEFVNQTLAAESPLANATPEEIERMKASGEIARGGRFFQMTNEALELGKKQVEYGRAGAAIMDAQSMLKDLKEGSPERAAVEARLWEEEKRAVDLSGQVAPKYYHATPIEQIGLDTAELLPQQIQSYKAAGIAGAIGAIGAGGLALAVTRSPAAARAAALKGASVLSKAGLYVSSYNAERGSQFLQYRGMKLDDGTVIDDDTARGAAYLYGAIAAGVEVSFFGANLKMFGPAGDAIASGGGKAFMSAMMRNSGARAVLADAGKRWAKGALAEGKEEGIQNLIGDAIGWMAKVVQASKGTGGIRLQKMDIAGSIEDASVAAYKAAVGTAVMGVGGAGATIMTNAMARDTNHMNGAKIEALANVAESSSTARAAPDVVAELVRRETAAQGQAITHVYVDAQAFSRLFQAQGTDAGAAATELMGEAGAQTLKEALAGAHDGKLEVPVVDYLDKWGGKQIARALAQDTSAGPGGLTLRQQVAQDEEITARRKALVKEYQAENAPAPVSEAEKRLVDAVQVQLTRTGVVEPGEARQMVATTRAFLRTQAEVAGRDPDELFANWTMEVQKANEEATRSPAALAQQPAEQLAPPTAEEEDRARWAGLAPELREREMFIDPGTGLRNERAFLAQGADFARPLVAHISVEGVKYANKVGHEVGNALYAAAAHALAGVVPDVAKVKGDFAVRVKNEAELSTILAAANEAMPAQGFALTGALGSTLEAAQAANIAQKTAAEEAGTRAKRGKRPKGLPSRSFAEFLREVWKGPPPDVVATHLAAVEGTVIDDTLKAAFKAMPEEESFRAVHIDPTTGFLSQQGFKARPAKAHVVSLDLNKLKKINLLFGEAGGDALLKAFADASRDLGAAGFDFAHFSGDEYAAQSNDPTLLQAWIDDLGEVCDNVSVKMPDGTILKGITFGYGIGTDYATADTAVEGHKRKGVGRERKARLGRDRRRGDTDRRALGGRTERAAQGGVREGRREGESQATAIGPRLAQGTVVDKEVYRGHIEELGDDSESRRWYTDDPSHARSFGPITKYRLRLDNPKTIDVTDKKYRHLFDKNTDPSTHEGRIHELAASFRRQGYDGLILLNWEGSGASYFIEDTGRAERLAQGERGYVDRMREGVKKIFKVVLTDKADLSTFLHESAHVFLDVMGDLAAQEGAASRLTDDWARTLEWLGVKDGSEIGVEQHEKFARAFETYLKEGVAPSAALVKPFQRFKLWLQKIYGAIAPGEIDDEIRGVFDRMLATDEEIERQKRGMGVDRPIFRSPEDAGMTPTEFQSYLDDREKAFTSAAQATARRVIDDKIKATETYLKAERQAALEDAGKEFDARPDSQAVSFLKDGQAGENEALKAILTEAGDKVGLDHDAVVAAVGDDVTKVTFRGMTETGGLSPDELAEIVGAPDGETLLKQIVNRPDKVEWSTGRALELLQQRAPDVIAEQDRLQIAAAEALHNQGSSSWLLKEWQALRKRGRADQGATQAPLESIRLAAADIVEGTRSGELRPGRVLQAERSAANRAFEAAAKQNWRLAAIEKQKQLLNHYIYRETTKALEDREKFEKLADKLTDRKRREALGKAGKSFLDAADTILEVLGFAEPTTDPAVLQDRKTTPEWMAALEEQGILPAFAGDRLSAILAPGQVDPGSLSVADMRMVHTALAQLWTAARDVNQVMLLGKRVQIGEVIRQIGEDTKELPRQPRAPASDSQRTLWYRGKQLWQGISSSLIDPEQMFRDMGETARRLFWDRYTEQRDIEDGLAEHVLKFFLERWDDMPAELQRAKHDRITVSELADMQFPADVQRQTVDENGQSLIDRAWMYMVALNMGNRSNMDRLLGGYEWTEDAVRSFLARNMKSAEWDFVEGVWALLDKELYPHVSAAFEATNGIKPEKIEALPFTLPDGRIISGGYFPARYDPISSRLGENQREEALSKLNAAPSAQATIVKSFTKSRAKTYSDVINLQWSEVPRHVAQVIHYVAFDSYIRDAGRVLAGMQNVVGDRLGEKYYTQMAQWLRIVASPTAETDPAHLRDVNWFLGELRSRFVTSTLGFSLTVAAGDLTNAFVAIAGGRTKARFATPALVMGLVKMDEITAKSPELRHRKDTMLANMRKNLSEVGRGSKTALLESVREAGWWLFAVTDRMASAQIWKGAYEQNRAAGMSEAESVREADSLVRRMLPSHDPAEQPAILRDRRGLGSLIAFMGYFNKLWNLKREILRPALITWAQADGLGGKVGALPTMGHAAGRVLGVILVSAVIAELLSGRGPEDDEDWGEWALRKGLAAPAQDFPIVGQVGEPIVNAAVGKLFHGEAKAKKLSLRASPVFAGAERLWKALTKAADAEKEPDDRIWALLEATGFALKLPVGSSQVGRTGRYVTSGNFLEDLTAGKPGEAVGGLIYGERDNQPMNLFTIEGRSP